jgi:hypothetical protein
MNDRFTIRMVTGFVGVFAILGLTGIIWLARLSVNIPEGLLTLVAGATGALGAWLANTRAPEDAEAPKGTPENPVNTLVAGGQQGPGTQVQTQETNHDTNIERPD